MATTKRADPLPPTAGPDPSTPEEFVERGWSHYSRKEYYRAEADFRRALEAQPDHPDILYPLALAQQASGRHQEAIQSFERIIQVLKATGEIDPVRAHMLTRLAHGHINRIKTGDWKLS